MAEFGNGNAINAQAAYQSSFGNLPDGTCYADLLGSQGRIGLKSDLRESFREAIVVQLKAMTTQTGGNGSTDRVLVPLYVDPKIVDTSRKQTPLVELIPRVSNMGRTAEYNSITAKGGAYFAAEGAALAETDTTVARGATAIKFAYAVGAVTGPGFATIPSYNLMAFQPQAGSLPGVGGFADAAAGNAMQLQLLVKARELKELEESTIVNGNASTNALSYNGIVAIMSTTNTVDKSNTALDLKDIETAAANAYNNGGLVNVAICDSATFVDLKVLLQNKMLLVNPVQMTEYGFSGIKFWTMAGELLIIPSRYLSTSAGSKSMYLLDLSVWEMRVLQDMTYEKLAKTNDSEKFMLKVYEALICRAAAFNASITNIA
jgi:hypothetical protein